MDNSFDFSFKKNIINYIIVYIAYAMGGIYFFYLKSPPKTYFFIFLLSVVFFRKIAIKKNEAKIFYLIFIVCLIFYLHKINYERGTLTNLLGYVIPILNVFLIIKIIGKSFFNYFVNVVYAFAIIGLVFWLAENLIPAFNDSIPYLVALLGTDPGGYNESLIIFAHEQNREIGNIIIRNNGGFWEPGAYVTTLVPAFLFSYLIYGLNHIKSKVILFTILTTFSTTGYFAIFVLLVYIILLSSYTNGRKITLMILFFIIVLSLYFTLGFLSTKIEKNVEIYKQADLTTGTDGRFIAFKKAVYVIEEHPLIGKDFITLRGDNIDYYAKDWVGYGWMELMAKIGLVFFGWYLLINYKFYIRLVKANSNKYNYKLLALLLFLAQYILLFGQALYAVPLFLVFLIFPIIYKNSDIYKLTNNEQQII